MPTINLGTADKTVQKPKRVLKHEKEWYFAVGIVIFVAILILATLVVLACFGIWIPLICLGSFIFLLAVLYAVSYLMDYYGV